MNTGSYDKVCYWTEQREESIPLRNLKNGAIGYSLGCTHAGETVQVKLATGELDSWSRTECVEASREQ
jgi:hypothetical protein